MLSNTNVEMDEKLSKLFDTDEIEDDENGVQHSRIAVVADIEKMSKRKMLAKINDTYQCRDSPNGIIKEYQSTTVTFGVVNALYLAIRFLKALAGAIGKLFPLASKAILQDNYVDDYTGGADTWEDAFELYTIN